jgi:peptidoglycan/xylan/chitin deacetylase (PgdA/CDA1 family)
MSASPSIPDIAARPTHTAQGTPLLYLTYDDGPTPEHTPAILDLLKQYQAKATFFVIGGSVAQHPDLLRAEAAAGHYVGNHTYTHVALNTVSKDVFVDELNKTKQAMLQAAGDLLTLDGDVRFMRPPYGEIDDNTPVYAAELGYAMVMWDVDPKDWSEPGTDAITNIILGEARPGHILLMHDGGGDRSQTVAATEIILKTLTGQGYQFVPVSYGQPAPPKA